MIRRREVLVCIWVSIASALPVAGSAHADWFTVYPRQVVDAPNWTNPTAVLGPPEDCFEQAWAWSDTTTFLEVTGWDDFTVPPGHFISQVRFEAVGGPADGIFSPAAVARVRGSVDPPRTSSGNGLSDQSGGCAPLFGGSGWDISRFQSWDTAAIANLIAGVRLVGHGPTYVFIESMSLMVETEPLPSCLAYPVDAYDFGLRLVGSTTDLSFRIYNTGGGTLEGDVQDVGPFAVVAGAGPYALESWQFRDVTVRFSPTEPGDFVAAIGPDCGVRLHGAAVMPASDVPDDAILAGLMRVSPQPCRDFVEIQFSLAREDHIALSIHDVSGRRIRSLERRWMDAGEHCLTWDGRTDVGERAAAGIYFARLSAGARMCTHRITRIR